MKTFILYPHIYIRKVEEGFLLYNTNDGRYKIYTTPVASNMGLRDDFTFEISKDNEAEFCDIADMEFGYVVEGTKPVVQFRNIEFASSKKKLSNALSYKDGASSLDMIQRISIYIDKADLNHDSLEAFKILNLPSRNTNTLSEIKQLFNNFYFPNLEEIEVCSSLTERAVLFIHEIKERDVVISLNTIAQDVKSLRKILDFATLNADCLVKLYLPLSLYTNIKSKISNGNVIVRPYSSSLPEILESNETNVYPLIFSQKRQIDLIKACKLSVEDILNTPKLYKWADLKKNQVVNQTFWGHLIFDEESIYSGIQRIGAIQNFADDFNNWIYDRCCNWFLTRRKKEKCQECLFADMCPSVSILEELEVIQTPCAR